MYHHYSGDQVPIFILILFCITLTPTSMLSLSLCLHLSPMQKLLWLLDIQLCLLVLNPKFFIYKHLEFSRIIVNHIFHVSSESVSQFSHSYLFNSFDIFLYFSLGDFFMNYYHFDCWFITIITCYLLLSISLPSSPIYFWSTCCNNSGLAWYPHLHLYRRLYILWPSCIILLLSIRLLISLVFAYNISLFQHDFQFILLVYIHYLPFISDSVYRYMHHPWDHYFHLSSYLIHHSFL